MNLLQHETSPYLLQHKNNPVHWMPWGEAAFKKALHENKPILISIGYSSCHWCHVMEHESFEDQETADLMNTLFVNIKVDREEYPDVDHMYMDAVQAMSGSGGWPLNVFLTPDKKAFYGGTYFPPTRAHGRASWKEVLINVSQYFTQNRNDVELQANKLSAHLKQISTQVLAQKSQQETFDITEESIGFCSKLLAAADTTNGGFGIAPKFPSTFSINYLLNHYILFQHEDALQHALLCLDKMMMGGIYDQLGGGFSRYSTDTYWIAPHFEKMLYDNALLIESYSLAYSITKREEYKLVIEQTIQWLTREMMSEEFGFYCAQDADSEGIEGKYYTWSYDELKEFLQDDFKEFANYYHVQKEGNWEHTNILYKSYESEKAVDQSLKQKLSELHARLFEVRTKRIKPMTDDKQLLSWNALMNKALVKAYTCTQEKKYVELAQNNMNFLLEKFADSKALFFHTYKNGVAKIPAYIDDLVYLSDALVCLSMATANTNYLHTSKIIIEFIFSKFSNPVTALFDFTNHDFLQVEINKKDMYDGAMPSPNSIFCGVLNYASIVFQKPEWKQRADAMIQYMFPLCKNHPTSFAIWCSEIQKQSQPVLEVTIVGNDAETSFLELYTKIHKPNVVYITSNKKEENIEALSGKHKDENTLFYICKQFECYAPTHSIKVAFGLII